MDDVAVLVAEDLKLDMVGVNDQLLDVDIGIAEGLVGFHSGAVESLDEASLVMGHAHAASAASRDGLDHDGVADFARDLDGLLLVLHNAVASGRDGNASLLCAVTGTVFVAHKADRFGGGPHEGDIGRGADLGEVGVLGKEAVAGMDRIDVGDLSCAEDAVDLEVAFTACGGTDADGLVGQLDVQGINVGFGIDGDGADTEFLAGANNAKCDLAAIGDEDFLKHGSGGLGVPGCLS